MGSDLDLFDSGFDLYTIPVILHKEEDIYVAECLEVGTLGQEETIEEALANLKEATRLYLEECPPTQTL